ncbi:glycoside hydrolase family 3 protein [Dothistroma septosporum NZE10]|uniref:beta-glucosidase n=1 Tax=Dothistroma septosporum (strain NZE10 / CBS 128990) TaxID=675120 RepID=N1PIL0_DOTSN|nr:glycoside hydrolase family 3 protein [Dothistroma septosporum NZE10]
MASSPTPPIASIIGQTGIVPENLVNAAAAVLVGIANTNHQEIAGALNKTGIDPRKRCDPSQFYDYGHSPAVYPSPEGSGDGAWANAYAQAKALVAQMSSEEKNAIVSPANDTQGCSGFTGNVSRLNFPGLCLNDASSGPRLSDNAKVNGYPAGLSVGASWDKGLAWERANYIGKEFKAKGINVALGPVVGPLGRIAKGGRNWEGFSNDPYLAGSLVEPTVQGLQQSVVSCVKHFITNEQETNRNPFLQGLLQPIGINLNNSVSSNLDDRTMHELYLWPFYDAVKAGAGSVMCSYNRINNSHGCQNSATLNGLLKTELGFNGFVVSDWYAQHTGIASADAGMDMVMPSGLYWGNDQLATAVSNGSLNATRLDDMATRVLASWYRYAPFTSPGVKANNATDARIAAAEQILFQSAVEGHVLVKNDKGALPLRKPSALSLFGWDSISEDNTSASQPDLYPVSLANTQKYINGDDFGSLQYLEFGASVMPAGSSIPEIAFNGTIISGGGSGGITPASMVSPYDAIKRETEIDGTRLYTDFVSQNPTVQPSDACLVLINAQSSETADRSTLADEYSDKLVANVASKCSNTIVVIHNAGVRLVDRWIEHPNVTAAIYAHLPGQASGDALVEILYGRQAPSGRLPYTVAKQESDYGMLLNATLPDAQNPQYSQSNFTEGVHIDYRYFIKQNIIPRFAFGYGLTYTTFSYSNLSITLHDHVNASLIPPDAGTKAPEGGLVSLYDDIATASVTVRNVGSVAAAEVAQLYLGIPNSGVQKALRGFEKHWIQPGASASYSFPLRRRDLSMWDTQKQQWALQEGEYEVFVGKIQSVTIERVSSDRTDMTAIHAFYRELSGLKCRVKPKASGLEPADEPDLSKTNVSLCWLTKRAARNDAREPHASPKIMRHQALEHVCLSCRHARQAQDILVRTNRRYVQISATPSSNEPLQSLEPAATASSSPSAG